MTTRTTLITFALVATLPALAHAQNLVTNPNFDTNASGWTFDPFGTGVSVAECGYDPTTDADGNPASGSIECRDVWPTASSGIGAFQCFAVTASTDYDIVADMLINTGQPVNGHATLDVMWFTGAGCTGSSTSDTDALFTPAAGWQTYFQTVTSPATAASVRVGLAVGKDSGPNDFSARFDDIRLGPAGTVPVELMGFSVE